MKILRTPNQITVVTKVPAVKELGRVTVSHYATDENGRKYEVDHYGFEYTDNAGECVGVAYCESDVAVEGCIAVVYQVSSDTKTKAFLESKRKTIEKIMDYEDEAAALVAQLQAAAAAKQAKFDALFVD